MAVEVVVVVRGSFADGRSAITIGGGGSVVVEVVMVVVVVVVVVVCGLL